MVRRLLGSLILAAALLWSGADPLSRPAARSAGAELRLADLTPKVRDLMAMTNLNQVFDLNLTRPIAVCFRSTRYI
ncbi:MAG TPA: hypothetical protein VLA96_10030 [Terriglobales bacterium]|nr:hypothetical protein [Terriglobales bacterium]